MRLSSLDSMELVALAALGAATVYLGVSDWKRRAVDLRVIVACYVLASCINIAILAGSSAGPDVDVSKKASTTSTHMESAGESALETVHSAAGSILTVLFLSGVMVAFWKFGLLALGDVLAVPAILSMLPLVASPIAIILYFVSAMAFVLMLSVVKNVRNNMRHRDVAYGALWHRLYLLLFCYYGDGGSCRYAFRYCGRTRRNYDGESCCEGREKVWLVPGLPLLLGYAPATLFLFVTIMLLHP